MRKHFVNRYPRIVSKAPADPNSKCRCPNEGCRQSFTPRPRDIKQFEHPQGGARWAVLCPFCKEDGPHAITYGSAITYYIERHRLAEQHATSTSTKRT